MYYTMGRSSGHRYSRPQAIIMTGVTANSGGGGGERVEETAEEGKKALDRVIAATEVITFEGGKELRRKLTDMKPSKK